MLVAQLQLTESRVEYLSEMWLFDLYILMIDLDIKASMKILVFMLEVKKQIVQQNLIIGCGAGDQVTQQLHGGRNYTSHDSTSIMMANGR